ncbi:MAG: TonB-dependent receptor domain-containing protein, partial [Rhizomicrobium sp.]
FWNKLHDAIANVTIASSPAGVTFQRRNAGDIDALGMEGDAAWRLNDALSLRAAFSVTDARVKENPSVIPPGLPSLTGNRPAQAPPVTITGGAAWLPFDKVKLDADLHWESARFEDDQNTMRLGSAFVLDMKASYLLTEALSAFVALDNATNANIATAQAADGTISYGQPRMWEVGLTYQP